MAPNLDLTDCRPSYAPHHGHPVDVPFTTSCMPQPAACSPSDNHVINNRPARYQILCTISSSQANTVGSTKGSGRGMRLVVLPPLGPLSMPHTWARITIRGSIGWTRARSHVQAHPIRAACVSSRDLCEQQAPGKMPGKLALHIMCAVWPGPVPGGGAPKFCMSVRPSGRPAVEGWQQTDVPLLQACCPQGYILHTCT